MILLSHAKLYSLRLLPTLNTKFNSTMFQTNLYAAQPSECNGNQKLQLAIDSSARCLI